MRTRTATTRPSRERLETERVSISSPSPSDCQAWVRVSNSSRGSFGRPGEGIKTRSPARAPLIAWDGPGDGPHPARGGVSAAQRGDGLLARLEDPQGVLEAGHLEDAPDLF